MAKKKVVKKKVVKSEPESAWIDAPSPIAMSAVLGQDSAIETLSRAMDSGRLHHAWIFHGPKGVGKFTSALAWASALLDPEARADLTGRVSVDPDSETQRRIRAGTHPDLFIVRKELARFEEKATVRGAKLATIPKDVVERYLIGPAKLAPVMSRRGEGGARAGRVFIVDEAELLDRSATNAPVQNALLKTLEEPAPGNVIILVTSSEDRLLATIRSRCQRVGFRALDHDAMRAWVGSSGVEATPEAHEWMMRFADGAPGRYAQAVEEGLYGWARVIEPMLARCARGEYVGELGPTMADLIEERAKGWVKAGLARRENRSKETANRDGAALMLALVSQYARPMLRNARSAAWAVHAIDMCERAIMELRSNVSSRFVMDHLSAGLSEPAPAL